MLTPETIKPLTLPWTPIKHYRALPKCPCLYFVLTTTGQVCYIGRSKQLKERWQQHHRLSEFLSSDEYRLAWLEVSDAALLPALERTCIQHFQPLGNKKTGRSPLGDERLIDTHVLIQPDLIQWAKEQPEGLAALVRKLLAAERTRRTTRPHDVSSP